MEQKKLYTFTLWKLAAVISILTFITTVFATEKVQQYDVKGDVTLGESERIETGLEFVRTDEFYIHFDEHFYIGEDDSSVNGRGNHSFLQLARMLIRNAKSLPLQAKSPSEAVDKNDTQNPAWCFYPYLLKRLATVELDIYELLKSYGDNSEDGTPPVLDSYLKDFEESSLRAHEFIKDPTIHAMLFSPEPDDDPFTFIATHPLLIYRMIRRFAEDLPAILSQPDIPESLLQDLSTANPENFKFPDMDDLSDALESIARIQRGTALKTVEFAKGKIAGLETGIQLNALQQLEVGLSMLELQNKLLDYAIEWVDLALKTVKQSPLLKRYPVIEKFFSKALEHVVSTHNKAWSGYYADRWHPNVFDSNNVTLPFNPELYTSMRLKLREEASSKRRNEDWNWAITNNFMQVCAGGNLQSDQERARLKCWDDKSRHPYWLINPLKVEHLSDDPHVFQIYDFIGDKMIENIRAEANTGLKRSLVVDRNNQSKSVVVKTRTSSQVWVYDDRPSGAFMKQVTKRMELMSSLTIEPANAADAFQVACYGISHHYDTHIDSFEDGSSRSTQKGNRITTIMGYLNDVKAGGRTGFPIAGIAADPVKGSIVVWDSLKRNGNDRDMRTWHGGCPVALGVKWITNKWVYYKENFQNFKCDLRPEE